MYLQYLCDVSEALSNQDVLLSTAVRLLNSVGRQAISRQDAAPCDQTTLLMFFTDKKASPCCNMRANLSGNNALSTKLDTAISLTISWI